MHGKKGAHAVQLRGAVEPVVRVFLYLPTILVFGPGSPLERGVGLDTGAGRAWRWSSSSRAQLRAESTRPIDNTRAPEANALSPCVVSPRMHTASPARLPRTGNLAQKQGGGRIAQRGVAQDFAQGFAQLFLRNRFCATVFAQGFATVFAQPFLRNCCAHFAQLFLRKMEGHIHSLVGVQV